MNKQTKIIDKFALEYFVWRLYRRDIEAYIKLTTISSIYRTFTSYHDCVSNPIYCWKMCSEPKLNPKFEQFDNTCSIDGRIWHSSECSMVKSLPVTDFRFFPDNWIHLFFFCSNETYPISFLMTRCQICHLLKQIKKSRANLRNLQYFNEELPLVCKNKIRSSTAPANGKYKKIKNRTLFCYVSVFYLNATTCCYLLNWTLSFSFHKCILLSSNWHFSSIQTHTY